MARIAKDDFVKEFNEWYESSGLYLSWKEKNNLRSRYRTRWNTKHKYGTYSNFRDIVDYEYLDVSMIQEHQRKEKEVPKDTKAHLRLKYSSLFQSFLGDLPQDTFDDDLQKAFNFWKEHMSEREACKFATIDVLYSYRYIGPKTSKYLQYKDNLGMGNNQFLARKD